MGSVSISPYTMPRNTEFRICDRISLNCFRPATALREWRDTNKCYPDHGYHRYRQSMDYHVAAM